MFNARPQPQATGENETIIAAQPGHVAFYFLPPAATKPSMQALTELLATSSYPVTAWSIRDGITTPLTIAAPPPGAVSFLFSGSKIYQLGDQPSCWDKRDQWEATILQQWIQEWNAARAKEPPPKPREMKPGDPVAVISNRGFF